MGWESGVAKKLDENRGMLDRTLFEHYPPTHTHTTTDPPTATSDTTKTVLARTLCTQKGERWRDQKEKRKKKEKQEPHHVTKRDESTQTRRARERGGGGRVRKKPTKKKGAGVATTPKETHGNITKTGRTWNS